jgi:hypothetical protein
MKRLLPTVLAILVLALAACRAPAGGGNTDSAAPNAVQSEDQADSATPTPDDRPSY